MSDIDIKALWQQQPAMPAPAVAELLARVAKLKKKTRTKLAVTNVLLVATCIFIVSIGWLYHPRMVTTRLGIMLMVIAMATYLLAYNRIIPLVSNKSNIDQDTHSYLQQLIRLRQRQEFLYRTMLTLYFILLSAGLCLYFIEFAARMTMLWRVVTYGGTACWVLFNWFYIRPRIIKKQQAGLDDLISRLQGIYEQFTAE
ncbi:MAG: hypothetical protein H0X33_03160 [Taibaiella sp.]|nr:hypothetical protein [Taibaiella sp.]